MSRIPALVRRFGRDERGAFAVVFGLMAIVLIALGGAAVDYVALQQARSRAQVALDAAALALQPQIFKEPINVADIKTKAENLLRDRLGGEFGVEVEMIDSDVRVNISEGSLFLAADMAMPTNFVSLVGVQAMYARIQSEATRKKLALEVAFVLDNSGSMTYTGTGANGTRQRILFLKDAANCAVNILFYEEVVDSITNPDTCVPATGAEQLEDVKVGIVPFTMFVNVGAANRNATWLDQNNASITANDNFDNDDDDDTAPGTTLPTRFRLFEATGESWRGCVEARPHVKSGTSATEYLDTDDTVPLAGNTLFVPQFSPDGADSVGGNNYVSDTPLTCDRPAQGNTTCRITQQRTCNWSGCSSATTTSVEAIGPTNYSSNVRYPGGWYGANAPSCSCRNYDYGAWSSGGTQTRTLTCAGGGYVPAGLSSRENQERVCKYYAGVSSSGFSSGPSADCTRTAILPLTSTPSTVTTTITGMTAEGGTNIHEGTAWGMRLLSPTLPFDQGAPYDEATSKVMIVMTDGENTAYNLSSHCTGPRNLNGSCYNSAYGFPYNSRNASTTSSSGGNVERLGYAGAGNGELVTAMNQRTSQTCENAKAAGITVYVIGLATEDAQQSTQEVVETMLTNCASSPDKAYFPETPGELKSVFKDIADDLAALRLAQ